MGSLDEWSRVWSRVATVIDGVFGRLIGLEAFNISFSIAKMDRLPTTGDFVDQSEWKTASVSWQLSFVVIRPPRQLLATYPFQRR